jgi:hypothetical protein
MRSPAVLRLLSVNFLKPDRHRLVRGIVPGGSSFHTIAFSLSELALDKTRENYEGFAWQVQRERSLIDVHGRSARHKCFAARSILVHRN